MTANPFTLPSVPDAECARLGEVEVWPDMHSGDPGDYDEYPTPRYSKSQMKRLAVQRGVSLSPPPTPNELEECTDSLSGAGI